MQVQFTPSAGEKNIQSPLLAIEETDSNKLLPFTAWRRPFELDLQRFCI